MTRRIDFRFSVTRGNAWVGDLEAVESSTPAIRANLRSKIKSSFSAEFLPPTFSVDWMNDEIRPVMILDGAEHSCGVFLPTTIRTVTKTGGTHLQIEAYDRSWKVGDFRTENMQYFAAETPYLNAVQSLLASAGIGLVSVTPSAAVLAEAREDWEVGTDYLSIINQLLSEINYDELWFDGDGLAVLRPAETGSSAIVRHILDENSVESLILPGMQRETDFYSTPNVFIVLCSNPDKEEGMVARAENLSSSSPLSVPRRGRRIVKVTHTNNIASQSELQLYANRLMTDSMIATESIQATTGLLPGFGLGDSVAIQYGDLFAVCREIGWSMELRPGGRMKHTLERQVMAIE